MSDDDQIIDAPGVPLALRYFGGAGLSHMKKYGTPLDAFAKVRAKASRHAARNPLALLRKELSVDDARRLIADGTISGGMIPKVETCIYALEQGVQGVVIIDGKMQHAVLLELLTDHGAGTLMTR